MANRQKAKYDEAAKLYIDGMRMCEIANYFGVSNQSVYGALKARGIEFRHDSKARFGADNHFYRGGKLADKRTHFSLRNEVVGGRIARETTCEECGKENHGVGGIEAHHCDYNEPHNVMWLCKQCHYRWHTENVAIPRNDTEILSRTNRDEKGKFCRSEMVS